MLIAEKPMRSRDKGFDRSLPVGHAESSFALSTGRKARPGSPAVLLTFAYRVGLAGDVRVRCGLQQILAQSERGGWLPQDDVPAASGRIHENFRNNIAIDMRMDLDPNGVGIRAQQGYRIIRGH
ncbi:hypothetical protein KXD96_22835 [Mycobacterium sp. SMC-2]|uniref:hypothetical protein n=1 Tax=Mycobacterium sp. SMC-2 TaxID=2857058 RepID=UPI0021B2A33D|nr:hypothetical protein [Mycobacterium sp. SMC-2]UXA05712.1 hypothetical protein KXD96_22835 [Mycobacterium sp. SMC-2]